MFEKFTERARQVVVLAQEEARLNRHCFIGTEHILLGLLREEEGIAARTLISQGVSIETVRNDVNRIVGQGEERIHGQIPFTPRAKKVLELSLREALSLGYKYIGTEHILLGLVRENEGVAMRILHDHGCDSQSIRKGVVELLMGPSGRKVPDTPQEDIPGSECNKATVEWKVHVTWRDGKVDTFGPWSRKPVLRRDGEFLEISGFMDEDFVLIPVSGLKYTKIFKGKTS